MDSTRLDDKIHDFSDIKILTTQEEEEKAWFPYAPVFHILAVPTTVDQTGIPKMLAIAITNDIGPIKI